MSYLIYEQEDQEIVQCAECHEILINFYSPQRGDLEISANMMFKIGEHTVKCPKKSAILTECVKGNHELEVIMEYAGNGFDAHASRVVRWCKRCGSVVGDIDFDGRTNPGQVMKMKFPLLIKLILKNNKRTE